jgi:putative nucleotidyltransferase with HDIG domain
MISLHYKSNYSKYQKGFTARTRKLHLVFRNGFNMEQNLPGHLKEWFADYCRGFYTENMADNRNIALKEEHTRLVCENMDCLAEDLALDDSDRETAQTIALFHDLGRFEQYRSYATFRDDISINHAALGVKILKEENVLNMVPEEEDGQYARPSLYITYSGSRHRSTAVISFLHASSVTPTSWTSGGYSRNSTACRKPSAPLPWDSGFQTSPTVRPMC